MCPSPSSALCPLLYRTEHFSSWRKGRKCAEKRGGRGVGPTKGVKRKKGRVKTGQKNNSFFQIERAMTCINNGSTLSGSKATPLVSRYSCSATLVSHFSPYVFAVSHENRATPLKSTPNMTGRGFHRTTEVIPRRPWKSKSPFASRPIKISKTTRTQGRARGTTRHFLQAFPSYGPPVVQSYRSPIKVSQKRPCRTLSWPCIYHKSCGATGGVAATIRARKRHINFEHINFLKVGTTLGQPAG